MIISGLNKRILILGIIQLITMALLLIISILQFTIWLIIYIFGSILYSITGIQNISTSLILLIACFVMIILILFSIVLLSANYFGHKIILTNEYLQIENIDTSTKIRFDQILNITEKPNLFGIINEYLVLKEEIPTYNKGIFKYLLSWKKTKSIPISIYNPEISSLIKEKIKIL
jgi:hypothetical protein